MSELTHKADTDNPVTVIKTLIQKIHVKVPLPAEQVSEVAKMQTEPVAVKTIYVYKDEAKKKLNLTKDIQDAPQQKVVSASTGSPEEYSQMVTTLLDTTAGESQAVVQTEPLPRFAAGHQGWASFDLLEKFDGSIVRIWVRLNLFQVKSLHFHPT